MNPNKVRRYAYAGDKLVAAEKLGYTSIAEALVGEYRKHQSGRVVGALLGFTANGVRFALKDLGEPRVGRGGFHEGPKRKRRQEVERG